MTQAVTAGLFAGAASVTTLLFLATRGVTPERAACPACGQREAHKHWCPHR